MRSVTRLIGARLGALGEVLGPAVLDVVLEKKIWIGHFPAVMLGTKPSIVRTQRFFQLLANVILQLHGPSAFRARFLHRANPADPKGDDFGHVAHLVPSTTIGNFRATAVEGHCDSNHFRSPNARKARMLTYVKQRLKRNLLEDFSILLLRAYKSLTYLWLRLDDSMSDFFAAADFIKQIRKG